MSKRLQVVMEESEYLEIRRAAERKRVTVSEWVRQALRGARRGQPSGDPDRKLQVIRAATEHCYPTADIDRMLAEIDTGYATGEET